MMIGCCPPWKPESVQVRVLWVMCLCVQVRETETEKKNEKEMRKMCGISRLYMLACQVIHHSLEYTEKSQFILQNSRLGLCCLIVLEMWKLHQVSLSQFTKQNHQVHAHEKKPHVSSFKVNVKSKLAQVTERERKHLDA